MWRGGGGGGGAEYFIFRLRSLQHEFEAFVVGLQGGRGGGEKVEFGFEIADVSFFAFAKRSLSDGMLVVDLGIVGLLLRRQQGKAWGKSGEGWAGLRCSVLRFPPRLRRSQHVLLFAAAPSARLAIVHVKSDAAVDGTVRDQGKLLRGGRAGSARKRGEAGARGAAQGRIEGGVVERAGKEAVGIQRVLHALCRCTLALVLRTGVRASHSPGWHRRCHGSCWLVDRRTACKRSRCARRAGSSCSPWSPSETVRRGGGGGLRGGSICVGASGRGLDRSEQRVSTSEPEMRSR